jgi:hypothetical protein
MRSLFCKTKLTILMLPYLLVATPASLCPITRQSALQGVHSQLRSPLCRGREGGGRSMLDLQIQCPLVQQQTVPQHVKFFAQKMVSSVIRVACYRWAVILCCCTLVQQTEVFTFPEHIATNWCIDRLGIKQIQMLPDPDQEVIHSKDSLCFC